MNQNKQSKTTVFYTSLLYLCSFFLFLEWLHPLEDITDTRNVTVFILFAIYCFIISLFQFKWWISFILKGFGLMFVVHGLFFDQMIFSPLWVEQLILEFSFNMKALFSQEFYYLTPLFRSFLFLILIWLMSYLLHYWFVQMKRIFLFVLLTFIYLTVLDTFTAYDAGISVVRAFVISLIALAIANLLKEFDQESIRFTWMKRTSAWLGPLIAMVLFTTFIGFIVPKAEPKWPDPVPFIYSASQGAGGGGGTIQKVGYGEDDSRLGGSFVQDYTPVFKAEVQEQHYWRIETKDVYTGKGWELSDEPEYQELEDGNIPLETFADSVETDSIDGYLELQNTSIGKLIYPYGVTKSKELTGAGTIFSYDSLSESVRTDFQVPEEMVGYQMQYENPSFAIHTLRNSSESDPQEIMDQYTQVPSNLPERVVELAEEITGNEDTRYDKAKAIERYFSSNGFEYQTTEVPVPQGNEDYVDQFLFESQVGYCDNFSTSMVVMLRSLDIPARWAKGFTSGDLVENNPGDEKDVYQVTNANAHSWVEVYFPESGWVPFEPTQGFSNPTEFHMGEDPNARENRDDTIEATGSDADEELGQQEQIEEEEAEPAFGQSIDNTESSEGNWWPSISILIILSGLSMVIYKTRYRWQTRFMSAKLTKSTNAKTFQDAYHYLIKLLHRKGHGKDPDQTLREYARVIDSNFGTSEMRQLTSYYERMLYKNEETIKQPDELTKLWKNLINQIMG
ncbi:transglutaminase TgpA family protein [Oceanobacillus halophilus]|uniref:Transglutaminase-like domain-containing protein n=1 Tax=Oceanobacillus halophilus TaxID=930130 RepID=A0A495A5C1_9BACI|nr:transglutaminaseTgpA domain-containing protein [Oceanobacillus halophilus]RKQ34590.1 hypothetical protein D8M06_06620 [Oceanobacillus halophilus]